MDKHGAVYTVDGDCLSDCLTDGYSNVYTGQAWPMPSSALKVDSIDSPKYILSLKFNHVSSWKHPSSKNMNMAYQLLQVVLLTGKYIQKSFWDKIRTFTWTLTDRKITTIVIHDLAYMQLKWSQS